MLDAVLCFTVAVACTTSRLLLLASGCAEACELRREKEHLNAGALDRALSMMCREVGAAYRRAQGGKRSDCTVWVRRQSARHSRTGRSGLFPAPARAAPTDTRCDPCALPGVRDRGGAAVCAFGSSLVAGSPLLCGTSPVVCRSVDKLRAAIRQAAAATSREGPASTTGPLLQLQGGGPVHSLFLVRLRERQGGETACSSRWSSTRA